MQTSKELANIAHSDCLPQTLLMGQPSRKSGKSVFILRVYLNYTEPGRNLCFRVMENLGTQAGPGKKGQISSQVWDVLPSISSQTCS